MLKHWSKKTSLSRSLLPISWLYGAVSKLNILLRSRNAYQSSSFVISVGNINVGGTGKTPLTIALATYLHSQGKKVAIIGHAYKAELENAEVVDSGFNVGQIGDEATQMLKVLNHDIMLVIGKNRIDGVKLAEEKGADVIILDDGFTATYIKRDLNVVVVDGKVQLGNQYVMPAGPLREPISGLKRSDCLVVLNRQRNLDFAYDDDAFYLKTNIKFDKSLATKSLFAFCGLGIPSKFYNSLNKEGLCLQETKSFADHHKYTNIEIESLIAKAQKKNLRLVTTLKDLVKIDKSYYSKINVILLDLELTKGFKQFLDKKISRFDNKN
ncbi:MAG TPA: tetraacyldisaccharide 4'-kinase [Alphaproteobacteria bacterium]|nr:tetraacyldisaccharide 4'-kinase [Alphaproteobacteria bacterium]